MKDRLANWARGRISGQFVDRLTGRTTPRFEINNIITYTAADIMARLVGGDVQYRPEYMGFIYGTKAAPGITDPITSRVQNWTDLAAELAPVNKANVLIAPYASSPGYTVDAAAGLPAGIYAGNAVTVSGHTGTALEYGFTAGGTYASPVADGDYLYHAMLISRLVSGSTITYLPFARVSLKVGAAYPRKPVGMDLSLFWSVVYN